MWNTSLWTKSDPHQDDDLTGVHCNGSQVVWILLVPSKTKERNVLRIFVDDRRVLKVAEIEHPNGACLWSFVQWNE